MKVHLPHYNLSGDVEFSRYDNGQTAIRLMDDGEVVAVSTVNLEALGAPTPGPGQIWVKTWSENDGMDSALQDAGVAVRTGQSFVVNPFGSVAVLVDLTPAAYAELEHQRGLA